MGEVQRAGVGGRAAAAVRIQQHMLGQFELIVQLVQRAQQDADPILIQKRHLLRVGELNACHVAAHP